MKATRAIVFSAAALLAAALDANALTRETRPFDDERADGWAAGASCLVRYYNTCTGWLWVWGGLQHGDRNGVVMSGCCPGGASVLVQTAIYTVNGAPPGYGYTGTLEVYAADANDCPTGSPFATQPFLFADGHYVVTNWGSVIVPEKFVLLNTVRNNFQIDPGMLATDHPAQGPSGPPACGTCFPASRVTRSFLYGSEGAPLCPGEPFENPFYEDAPDCDAELVWEATFVCPIRIQETSWSKIKDLYK